MDDDDVVGVNTVELGDGANGAARGVHVAEGLHEHHLRAAEAEAPLHHDRGFLGVFLEAAANFLGELVQDHLADIVAGFLVLRARVPQTNNEPRIRHIFALSTAL